MSASIEIQNGVKVLSSAPADWKYLNASSLPYANMEELMIAIPLSLRSVGLTVNVAGTEYWWETTDLATEPTVKNKLREINHKQYNEPDIKLDGDTWYDEATNTFKKRHLGTWVGVTLFKNVIYELKSTGELFTWDGTKLRSSIIDERLGALTVREDFPNHNGLTINVTTNQLPTSIDNIFLYVNGILKQKLTDFTVLENSIILKSAVTNANISIFWFLDKLAYLTRRPSTIDDLSFDLIGTTSVRLKWTACGGYANQGSVDSYLIYYSNATLTTDNYLSAKYVVVNTGIVSYGNPMEFIMTGLDTGTAYYMVIVGNKNGKVGVISKAINFKTIDLLVPQPIGYYIPLTTESVIDHQKSFQSYTDVDGSIVHYSSNNLVDGSVYGVGSINQNSITGKYFWGAYFGKFGWPNYGPYQLVFDLKGLKRITSINIHSYTTNAINVFTSYSGSDFSLVDSIKPPYVKDINQNVVGSWVAFTPNNANRDARYVKFEFYAGDRFGEVAIYGSEFSNKMPKGSKVGNNFKKKTVHEFMGSNTWLSMPYDLWWDMGISSRIYSNWDWYISDLTLTDTRDGITKKTGWNTNTRLWGDTSNGVENQLRYDFKKGDSTVTGNMDRKLSDIRNHMRTVYNVQDCETYLCVKSILGFQWLGYDVTKTMVAPWSGSPSFGKAGNFKIVDYNIYKTRIDANGNTVNVTAKDPYAYRFIAQCMFIMAARWGRGIDANGNARFVDASLIGLTNNSLSSDPANPLGLNQDLVKYLEVENEPNRDWNGEDPGISYYHPEEFAALLSACYDGHKGSLGPGFGVKQADMSMKFVSAGLVSQDTSYIKRIMMWCDTNRGIGDYPFDVVSIHYYHNTNGGQSGDNRRGLSPDTLNPVKTIGKGGQYFEVMKFLTDWRDRELPNTEFWIGETGYDENPTSKQTPVAQADRSFGLLKADFTLRTFLHGMASDINAIQHYMIRNDTQQSYVNTRKDFLTYYTPGYYDNLTHTSRPESIGPGLEPIGFSNYDYRRYPPLDTYYYIRNFMHHLKDMYCSHIIRLKNTEVDGILKNINESDNLTSKIQALAFRTKDGTKTAIVLWLGLEVFQYMSCTVAVDASEVTIQYTTLDNSSAILHRTDNTGLPIPLVLSESSNVLVNDTDRGITSTLNSYVYGADRLVDLTISGTPSILWTKNIGIKSLTPPILKIRVLNSSSLFLYWIDKNKENVGIEILQKRGGEADFTSIFKDTLVSQEYTVAGLTQNTDYTYIIRFYDYIDNNIRYSEYSNECKITTYTDLGAITNITSTLIGYNKIGFTWEYDTSFNTYTESFIISRSDTPTGTYNRVGSVHKSLRTFTDNGLAENTKYYYKIQAYSNLSTGPLSGFMGFTTLAANLNPPALLSAQTSYFGNRITIWFDKPLSASISIAQNITIYDLSANPMVALTPISIVVNSSDNTSISIMLGSNLTVNSDIVIGYDGQGILKSVFNVSVEPFSETRVTNNVGSESLVNKKINVSLNGDHTAETKYIPFKVPEGSFWNEKIAYSSISSYIDNVIDSNGNATNICVSMPKYATSVLANNVSTTPYPGLLTGRSQAVGSKFPAWVAGAGGNVGVMTYPTITQPIYFQNLQDKEYVIECLIVNEPYKTLNPTNIEFVYNYSEVRQTINGFNNHIAGVISNSGRLVPFVPTVPLSGVQVIPLFNTKSVMVGLRPAEAAPRDSSVLCGVILTEINNESYGV